ncbi:MAG: ExbD/TolR family protein [Steroidobacteraceae bacterium]
MMSHRIKKHRRRSHPGDSHMALVPFIDMMTILVVFLLIHMSDADMVPNTKNISIPQSISQTKPRATVVVMVTKDEVLVDGRSVVSIADVRAESSTIVQSLKLALTSQAARVLTGIAQDSIAEREVTILGDRDLPYDVLKKIMATCTQADYGKVSLAVLEREGGA